MRVARCPLRAASHEDAALNFCAEAIATNAETNVTTTPAKCLAGMGVLMMTKWQPSDTKNGACRVQDSVRREPCFAAISDTLISAPGRFPLSRRSSMAGM